jgi:hypothetical protein
VRAGFVADGRAAQVPIALYNAVVGQFEAHLTRCEAPKTGKWATAVMAGVPTAVATVMVVRFHDRDLYEVSIRRA